MGSYNTALVVLSVVVAAFASFTALDLASRVSASNGWAERAWLLGGACSMGMGIWSMHFIAMLAFNSPVPLGYDLAPTVLSLLIAIIASGFALYVVSRETLMWQRLTVAAIVMAIAIVSMHHVGMAAIVLSPPMVQSVASVIGSVAVAIGASLAAFSFAFRLQRPSSSPHMGKPLGALLMGVAIAGTHYTAMAGVYIDPAAVSLSGAVTDEFWLAGAVAAATVVILSVTLVLSFMEAHVAARTRQISASLEHAQESNKAKDEFLAMLGHELRNPVAAILNAVAMLDTSQRRSASDDFALGMLQQQVTHLRRIVDDLVDVGRATAGKITLQLQPMDLYTAASNSLAAIQTSRRGVQHKLECTGTSVWIDGDSTRVEQVISNLLMNAVAYSPEGSTIRVKVQPVDSDAVLTVEDPGIGLTREEMARVFELFYQAKRIGNGGNTGLGIGLTLVRQIVELHGGTVSIESRGVGLGTTVSVKFTAITPKLPEPAAPAAERRSGSRKIVVVDDDRNLRESWRILLSRRGHTVITADDGDMGLQCIQTEKPDIALVDIRMPRMSGYEVARQVRAARLNVFLVALTGYGQAQDKAHASQSGFDAYLTKPATLDEINQVIAAADARESKQHNAPGRP